MREGAVTGGCQCGAARFRVGGLGRASICHCRMCQKAFGSFFGPLVTARGLEWTRGEPKRFASSNAARRGFCGDCGTPLTYEYESGIDISIGSLDDPELAPPTVQLNPNDELSFFGHLHVLPGRPEGEQAGADAFLAAVVGCQHPDHDTQTWPFKESKRK